ncbi:MAG: PLDc N-terminal domain-containing protein [Chitinophagaceae bacterium]|nr:PLDc N-terminal domain-containing protein [Chitinophagaceae bacterium]
MRLLTPDLGILIWMVFALLILVPLALALWHEQNPWLKIAWTLIILCLPIVGGIAYLLKFIIGKWQQQKAA